MRNILDLSWIHIDHCYPPTDKLIEFWTGERSFNGIIDEEEEIWERFEHSEEFEDEYHSNIGDGYITHWRELQ